jgi:EmrB/QacA subfamily drug resistance transporter
MANILKPPCDEGVILAKTTAKLTSASPVEVPPGDATGPEDAINQAPTSGAVAVPLAGRRASNIGFWVLVATILGSSMAFIDGTVVNVALPVLQTELRATVGDAQWVVEAYSLFLASLILVGGSLGDSFGRKRIFAIGIALFTVASVLCGLSPNVTLLIIARAVQGIGGALLVPGSLAIISASFDSKERGRAIGTWSGFTAITSVIGPVLGGALVQYASWRWVFFINVPLAAIVLFVLFWRVPESRDTEDSPGLDWVGALLATLGLGGIVYGLIQAGNVGLGPLTVLGALAGGVVALIVFIIVEARSHSPMVPLNLFRSRTFSGANLLTLFLYAALGGTLFFLPFNLISVQGYPPSGAGAAMLPTILILFLLSRWSGGLINRYGAKLPLIIGPCIAAVGFALFALPDIGGSYWTTFFPASVVLGIGMAISVAPLTTAVMGAVDAHRSGTASGINNAVSRTAGLLAIAVLGIIVLVVFNGSLDSHLATLNLPGQVLQAINAQRFKLVSIQIPVGGTTGLLVKQAINESFVAGFRAASLTGAGLALASALSSWLLIEGKRPEH